MFSFSRCIIPALLAALYLSPVLAQDVDARKTPKEPGTPNPSTLRELIDQSLAWYEVFATEQAEQPAKPLVALRWANNARGSEDGTTVLFVAGGRPVAVCCIYPWDKRLEHGFESLSRQRVIGRRDGRIVWAPQEAGVSFAQIPEAPTPEEGRIQRLRQMKALAEQFQATMLGWKVDSTDREELRLLSKPLFRYEPQDEKVIDGAVFAFVTGTDPEVLLMIEAVREGERTTWQYAFVRRTSGQLEGRWQDKAVWRAERHPQQHDPKKSYFTLGTPLPPEILAQEQRAESEAKSP
jgi:hypothetical protein